MEDDFLTLKNEKSYLKEGDNVSFIDNHSRVLSGIIIRLLKEYDMVVVEYLDHGKTIIESIIPEMVFLKRQEAIDYIIDNNLDIRLNE